MANNIEINYYNGSVYTVLYPKINLNNNDGSTLSSSYIPNLPASKITSGIVSVSRGGTGVTSYSSLATQISPYLSTGGISSYSNSYTGTGSATCTVNFSGLTSNLSLFIDWDSTGAFYGIFIGNKGFLLSPRNYEEGTKIMGVISYSKNNIQFNANGNNTEWGLNYNRIVYYFLAIG